MLAGGLAMLNHPLFVCLVSGDSLETDTFGLSCPAFISFFLISWSISRTHDISVELQLCALGQVVSRGLVEQIVSTKQSTLPAVESIQS